MNRFPSEIRTKLRNYVYLYRHPESGRIFYIGKGVEDRAFSHLKDKSENKKVELIKKIRKKGKEPVIEILRYGLTEDQAALIEASAIDLLGLKKLTNKVHGKHKETYGRISVKRLKAKACKIRHKVLLIRINRLFREDMSKRELYEVTRGIWKLGERREDAEYAMAVFQSVVQEVYKITKWYPAGSTKYHIRKDLNDLSRTEFSHRVEFTGKPALQYIRDKYISKSVRKYFKQGWRSPVVYVNI